MGFYESGTNNSVRKEKVNSETQNWSISHLLCVLRLLLPRQHCVHCDLARAPLCRSDGERCLEVLHRTCYEIKPPPVDGAFYVWIPTRKLFFLSKEREYIILPRVTQAEAHTGCQKSARAAMAGETGAHMYNKEIRFYKSFWKTDQMCSAIGIKDPRKWPFSVSRPEIWGQELNKIQEEKKYSPNTTG